jgi:glycosyltransferase involved in cell wall biosynthesis
VRILLDMQSLQTPSRRRGIGRYSLSLARAMAACGRGHTFEALLNGVFADTLGPARRDLSGVIEPRHMHVWQPPDPGDGFAPSARWRQAAGLCLRQYAIETIGPDLVHTTSLFEGARAVTPVTLDSVTRAVTQYDLVPLLNAGTYLADRGMRRRYHVLLEALRQADVLLAISDYSRREAIDALGLPPDRVAAISGDADPVFRRLALDPAHSAGQCAELGVRPGFVLYTGNIDPRKNLQKLVEAYGRLPAALRRTHQLVVLADLNGEQRYRLDKARRRSGVDEPDVRVIARVDDDRLVFLYNACRAFVFPSLHEGFGLPVLEALRCGAAVVASNTTSIPEVMGLDAALFDPTSADSIAGKLAAVLQDDGWNRTLRDHAAVQAAKFSWRASAERALDALEAAHERRLQTRHPVAAASDPAARRRRLLADIAAIKATRAPTAADRALLAIGIDEAAPGPHPRQVLLDESAADLLPPLRDEMPEGWRIEPVRRRGDVYVYACPGSDLDDTPAAARRGDVFLCAADQAHLLRDAELAERTPGWLGYHRLRGMRICLIVRGGLPTGVAGLADGLIADPASVWPTLRALSPAKRPTE